MLYPVAFRPLELIKPAVPSTEGSSVTPDHFFPFFRMDFIADFMWFFTNGLLAIAEASSVSGEFVIFAQRGNETTGNTLRNTGRHGFDIALLFLVVTTLLEIVALLLGLLLTDLIGGYISSGSLGIQLGCILWTELLVLLVSIPTVLHSSNCHLFITKMHCRDTPIIAVVDNELLAQVHCTIKVRRKCGSSMDLCFGSFQLFALDTLNKVSNFLALIQTLVDTFFPTLLQRDVHQPKEKSCITLQTHSAQ